MQHILHIDDDVELAQLIGTEFRNLGYAVTHFADGARGLEAIQSNQFHAVILDVNMPAMNGFDVLREIRKRDEYLPVLMLTSNADDADKVAGLELGADDYVTKPFKLPELRARVRAMLRRSAALGNKALPESDTRQITVGSLTLDLDQRCVSVGGRDIALTPLEFDMLAFLASTPGRVFTREQILEHVWGVAISDYNASINSLVRRLRVKVEKDPLDPKYILTVRGVGFKFASPADLAIES